MNRLLILTLQRFGFNVAEHENRIIVSAKYWQRIAQAERIAAGYKTGRWMLNKEPKLTIEL